MLPLAWHRNWSRVTNYPGYHTRFRCREYRNPPRTQGRDCIDHLPAQDIVPGDVHVAVAVREGQHQAERIVAAADIAIADEVVRGKARRVQSPGDGFAALEHLGSWSNHALEDDRLSGGQAQRHVKFVLKELIDGFAGTGAGREAVIVEHHESALRHTRPDKLHGIHDRRVDIEIDVQEGNAFGLQPGEGLRDQPLANVAAAIAAEIRRDLFDGGIGEVALLVEVSGRWSDRSRAFLRRCRRGRDVSSASCREG